MKLGLKNVTQVGPIKASFLRLSETLAGLARDDLAKEKQTRIFSIPISSRVGRLAALQHG